MKKGLFIFLISLVAFQLHAQVNTPIGVYEAKDKELGMTRLGYLEINIDEPVIPDFSQQFVKGQTHQFMLLPENFQKKPSTHFKGQKASGFVRFQSKMLMIVNTEVCKLSNPTISNDGWTLDWENEMGKKGKCTLHVPTDSTLLFIGLGSFDPAIGPDSLLFMLNKKMTADKSYLVRKVQPKKVEPAKESASSDLPADLPEWNPVVPQTIKIPAANSGVIKGMWMGRNTDGSNIQIRLNSTAKTVDYYGQKYFGTIKMEGPTFIMEGVVRITKLEENRYALYTRPLDTDASKVHYSVVSLYYKNLLFYPTSATPALNAAGKKTAVAEMIYCKAGNECFTGMFTTGKEVNNFPLNLYQKDYFKNNEGSGIFCHGFIFTSFNMGSRTDYDMIISTEPIDEKSIKIKYKCGRTDNVYTAILVYDAKTKILKPTQVTMVKSESEYPDMDDCYLSGSMMKYVGPIK